jgi:hypothetical protein
MSGPLTGGWYSQHDTAANPMVHPGRADLRGVGLDPPDG